MIHKREAGLDMQGVQGKCSTAAAQSFKIPFVLQKGRTVYLHHEQKCYIGQEILCMTGDSINVRRSYIRPFCIHSWAEGKAGLSPSYTKAM